MDLFLPRFVGSFKTTSAGWTKKWLFC